MICGVTHLKIKMEKKKPPKNGNLVEIRKMKIMRKKIICCNTDEQLSEQKGSIQWIQ